MTNIQRRLFVAMPIGLLAGCLFNGGSSPGPEPDPSAPAGPTPNEPPAVVHPRITAYVTGRSPLLTAFDVDPDTAVLTQVGASAGTGNQPQRFVVDPVGKFAYLVNQINIVSYRLDGDGNSPVATGETYGVGNVVGVAMHPSGIAVYAIDSGNDLVAMFTADPDSGSLEPNGNVATAARPVHILTHPNGRFAYVVHNDNGAGNIWVYAIDSTGVLSERPANRVSLPFSPLGKFAIDRSGTTAYLTVFPSELWSYQVDPDTGALQFIESLQVGATPAGVAVDPSGRFVYVVVSGQGSVSAFSLGNNVLTFIDTYATGDEPTDVAVDASGRFVYVTNDVGNSVSVFEIDGSTGALRSRGQPSPMPVGYRPVSILVVERPQ